MAKPRQDFRFDLPTVGLETVRVFEEAGARVLALEARKSLFLDREQLLAAADRAGIAIIALDPAAMETP